MQPGHLDDKGKQVVDNCVEELVGHLAPGQGCHALQLIIDVKLQHKSVIQAVIHAAPQVSWSVIHILIHPFLWLSFQTTKSATLLSTFSQLAQCTIAAFHGADLMLTFCCLPISCRALFH